MNFENVLPPDVPVDVTLSLMDQSTNNVLWQTNETLPMASSDYAAVFPISGLSVGAYPLEIEVAGVGGGNSYTKQLTFQQFTTPEWLGNDLGISRDVMSPWTPLVVTENSGEVTVQCWGRTYVFDGGPFPTRIVSQGMDLLRNPVELVIEVDGIPVQLSPADLDVTESADDRVIIEGYCTGALVRLDFEITVEYDGMIKTEWVVSPAGASVELNSLVFRCEIANSIPELVRSLNLWTREGVCNALSGTISSDFLHYVWTGNSHVGLSWFAESDQDWHNAGDDPAFQLAPDAQGAVLELNIIDHPIRVESPLAFTFGLHATPTKNLAGFRDMRLAMGRNANLSHPFAIDYPAIKSFSGRDGIDGWGFNTPVHMSDEDFQDEMQVWADLGQAMPLYICPYIADPRWDVQQNFKDEWFNGHSGYPFASPDTSYMDYLCWEVDRLVTNADLNAIYIDLFTPRASLNELQGAGYEREDGTRGLTVPIFSTRETAKRLYRILHECEVPPLDPITTRRVWTHGGISPVLSFTDVYIIGEGLSFQIAEDPNYFHATTVDEWRALYNHQASASAFLPSLGRNGDDDDRMTVDNNATFMALTLLHDTVLWNNYTFHQWVNEVYEVLDSFGIREEPTEFLPYWDQSMVPNLGSNVLTSVYRKQYAAMIVLVNPTDSPISTSVNVSQFDHDWPLINQAKLIYWPTSGIPWESGVSIEPEIHEISVSSPVSIDIPPCNFLLLSITTPPTNSTIYFDSFDGLDSVVLSERAPETAPDAERWVSTKDGSYTWKADGTFNIGATSEALSRNAFLPFIPESGKVYELSATVNLSEANSSYLAVGFAEKKTGGSAFASSAVNAAPYMFMRSLDNSSNPAQTVTVQGPATTGLVGGAANGADQDFLIRLDTTDSAWVATFFVNNVEVRSVTYMTNPVIRYVGFGLNVNTSGALSGVEAGVRDFTLIQSDAAAGMALGSGFLFSLQTEE